MVGVGVMVGVRVMVAVSVMVGVKLTVAVGSGITSRLAETGHVRSNSG